MVSSAVFAEMNGRRARSSSVGTWWTLAGESVGTERTERQMRQTSEMTNADVVRRGYPAFNEADIDTIVQMWADDAT